MLGIILLALIIAIVATAVFVNRVNDRVKQTPILRYGLDITRCTRATPNGITLKPDEACIARLQAEAMLALGNKEQAKEVMCGSQLVMQAFKQLKQECK